MQILRNFIYLWKKYILWKKICTYFLRDKKKLIFWRNHLCNCGVYNVCKIITCVISILFLSLFNGYILIFAVIFGVDGKLW